MMETRNGSSTFTRGVSVELACALLGDACDAGMARLLVIKGPSLTFHGLRAPRAPSDVDVLVHPDDVDQLTRVLEGWGWRQRIDGEQGRATIHHSITYLKDGWPCDIDVHKRFPGFLAPPERVFEALWSRRVLLPIAGHRVPATDLAGSVLVMALHALRNSAELGGTSELDQLARRAATWDEALRRDVGQLALKTGCAHTLESVWPRLGIDVDTDLEDVPADELTSWRRRTGSHVPTLWTWWGYIRSGSPREALARLKEAIWPSESRMRATRIIAPGREALNHARIRRLRGAVGGLLADAATWLRGGRRRDPGRPATQAAAPVNKPGQESDRG